MEKSKPWFKSLTVWGAVITAASVFVPRYAPTIEGTTTDIVTIVGLVGTIIGRFRATKEVVLTSKE